MKEKLRFVKKQMLDEKGQGMAEYSLVLALIALVLLVGFYSPFGEAVKKLFQGNANSLIPAMTGNGT